MSGPDSNYEVKYLLPADRSAALRALVEARLDPDPTHPVGHVRTLYLDDRGFSLLAAKLNSDYLKQKIRLRAYADDQRGPVRSPVYLENKQKVGARRRKRRWATGLDGRLLAGNAPAPDVFRDRITTELLAQGLEATLQPVVRVDYLRCRFVDRFTGARVSVDSGITAPWVHPLIGRTFPGPLAETVLEIKGADFGLPRSLQAAVRHGARHGAFSKYERCVARAQAS